MGEEPIANSTAGKALLIALYWGIRSATFAAGKIVRIPDIREDRLIAIRGSIRAPAYPGDKVVSKLNIQKSAPYGNAWRHY